MTRNYIQFEDCSIGYEKPIINALNLSVNENDFVTIVGQTGLGKSTLLRMIGQFDTKDRTPSIYSGSMKMDQEITTSVVFQSSEQLLPWKTVVQNVMLSYYSGHKKISKSEAQSQAKHLLHAVGLSTYEEQYPNSLSGGMRQRVAIARAMFTNPDLVLMDEPFSSLDVHTKQKLQSLLLVLAKEHGLTVLFVTHDIHEAIFLSTKVLAINSGGDSEIFEMESNSNSLDMYKKIYDYIKT